MSESLLFEYLEWESVRAQVSARYQPPLEPTRTVICLDGIPGAGKSTTLKWLQAATGASYLSMARFAESRDVTADDRRHHQLRTHRPHPVDLDFLASLSPERGEGRGEGAVIVLEKFPRTVIESLALIEAANENALRLEVLHLELPGDQVELSTRRQLDRGPRHGRMPTADDARHRALVHLARATSGRETLRSANVPIHTFDMTRPEQTNQREIRRALRLDFDSVPWHRRPLELLQAISERLGIEAWAASGHVYRPFWNGRFGPAQQPTDVDVAVDREHDVEPLLEALRRAAPHQRWSVLCPSARLKARHGIATNTAAEAKSYATWLHRTGLLRLTGELLLPPGAEAALRTGTLRLNPNRAATEATHLPRVLTDYPGLTVDPDTAQALGWPRREPTPIRAAWRALKQQTGPHHPQAPRCRRGLTPEEQRFADQIRDFHHHRPAVAEPPPLPPKTPLPRHTTLEHVAREIDDAGFGEWFLEQTHHHRPLGGADPYLRSVLDFSLFHLGHRDREQSPLHQGWPLERHLAQSVLQLKTDELLEGLAKLHPPEWLKDLRLGMRLAMLFHDTGKLCGHRPARHPQISARLFARFKPRWFPERLTPLTQWLIRTHDVFGAFGRGLTEAGYYAALDSQAARQRLLEPGLPLPEAAAINKQLWSADVGSIAALRWLLPIAGLVERLLLATPARRAPRP